MDFGALLLCVLFLLLGLPLLYVGWLHLSGRGTPTWARSNYFFRVFFTQELDPGRRQKWWHGLVQIVGGIFFAFCAVVVLVQGVG